MVSLYVENGIIVMVYISKVLFSDGAGFQRLTIYAIGLMM